MTQNMLLIYKLLELENARKTLDQGLCNFTNQANQEVQQFMDVPFSHHHYSELSRILDAKCQTVNNLVTALQDVTHYPPFSPLCVKASEDNGAITNRHYLFPDKVILTTDVLKFGPILQNVLLASSITKTVQVLGATLSLQQLQQLLDPKAVNNDVFHSIEPSQDADAGTTHPSSDFQIEENELVIFKEKPQVSVDGEPPLINQCQKGSLEALPTKPVSQKISPPHSTNIRMNAKLALWEGEGDIPPHHQKQTAAQLLDFLRTSKEKRGATQAASTWLQSLLRANASRPSSSATTPPPPQAVRQSGGDGGSAGGEARRVEESAPVEEDGRGVPVFSVKRVASEGALTYSCMVLTETELWDVGEVVTREAPGPVEHMAAAAAAATAAAAQPQPSGGGKGHGPALAQAPAETPQGPRCANATRGGSAPGRTAAPNRHAGVPGFEVSAFKEIEVVVSHVVTPGHFYIQRPDGEAKQRALVSDWKGRLFSDENSVPDIGTLVMAFLSEQNQWFRAQVLKICGVSGDARAGEGAAGSVTNIRVEVLRLDHGDRACLSLGDVGYLTPDMAALPLQAAQVSLANVTPVEGQCWTEEAVSWFKAAVENRTLYARLHPRGSAIAVQLFLERGTMGAMRRGASLSLRLAQSGHAKHDQMKAGAPKRGGFQPKKKKQAEADWQRYIISCYTKR